MPTNLLAIPLTTPVQRAPSPIRPIRPIEIVT